MTAHVDDVAPWVPSDPDERIQTLGFDDIGVSPDRDDRLNLVSSVSADPHRESFEKETGFLCNAGSDAVQVHTAEPGLIRRLILHPHFRIVTVEQADGLRTGIELLGSMESPETSVCDPSRRSIYAVDGLLPIGCLTVGTTVRKSSGHSDVVSERVLKGDV